MKVAASIIISLCASFAFAADERDVPGDMYLQAYLLEQKAGKLAKKGSVYEAIQSYKQECEVLTAIHVQFPKWRVQIVEWRRSKAETALSILENQPPIP